MANTQDQDELAAEYFTREDLCALLHLTSKQLWLRRSKGYIPAPDVCIGRNTPLWKREYILDWLDMPDAEYGAVAGNTGRD